MSERPFISVVARGALSCLAVLTLSQPFGSWAQTSPLRQGFGGPSSIPPRAEAFVAGEILVKLKPSTRADLTLAPPSPRLRGPGPAPGSAGTLRFSRATPLTSLLERSGVSSVHRFSAKTKSTGLDRLVKLDFPHLKADLEGTRALIALLAAQPDVEYAEPNVLFKLTSAPDDPYFNSSGAWGQDFGDLWGLHAIDAGEAWTTTEGEGIVVAVVDTGVDLGHEDIAGNIWQNAGELGTDGSGRDKRSNGVDDDGNGFVDDWVGWNFNARDNQPIDEFGHGTHVAGTIAAMGGNGIGIVGVAPRAKIMAVRAFDASGSAALSDVIEGIVYAADNGARVINASFGTGLIYTPRSMVDAVSYAHDVKGLVFVAAAGNANRDVGSEVLGIVPANLRDSITVAAVDHEARRATFSNFGGKIDVAAPGGGDQDASGRLVEPARSILSLLSAEAAIPITGDGALVVGQRYLRQAGTSMAAPHVSGIAALVLARHPEFSPEEVRQAIRAGSQDVGAPGFDSDTGYGFLNAAAALAEEKPVAAQLTGPIEALVSGIPAAVRGTASGRYFADWRLEYGRGEAPSSWSPVASSSTPVVDGVLAIWDVESIPEGAGTLRLQATNTDGRVFEDRLLVFLDSVTLRDAEATSVFRAGETVAIVGTVTPADFVRYEVRIRASKSGWLASPKLTLPGGGTGSVVDGLLAEWDTTGLPADHYTVFVVVTLADGSTIEESRRFIVDPSLHPGWPQKVPAFYSFGLHSIWNHVTVADIDRDPLQDKEILVGYGELVRVYDHTGRFVPGWPQSVDVHKQGTLRANFAISPAAGDLTGDGVPEIVSGNAEGDVIVWRSDGTILPGWPKRMFFPRYFSANLAVEDLDGDGLGEIILATEPFVMVFDHTGRSLPGWPKTFDSMPVNLVSVGDVDGDGVKEIVVTASFAPTPMTILRIDGTALPGWPRLLNPTSQPGSGTFSSPVLGDLDGNGDLEIVVVSSDRQVHVFNHDGTSVSGWPKSADTYGEVAIGDIDGDGRPEIVAGNSYSGISAWHGDGTRVQGWPFYSIVRLPVLADVDGDQKADVVASRETSEFALTAFTSKQEEIRGFPKPTVTGSLSTTNAPAIADLDGDGLLEMAWIECGFDLWDFNLYVWDLEATATSPTPWPMFHHDAGHRGAPTQPIARRTLHDIAGRITDIDTGQPVSSVTVHLSGFLDRRILTNGQGDYVLDRLPSGTYTVTAERAGYDFGPREHVFPALNRSQVADFRGVANATSFLVTAAGKEGGRGRVAVAPLGASCSNADGPDRSCSYAVEAGARVTLEAATETGSVFSGWSLGDTGAPIPGCSSTGPCVVTISGGEDVRASFQYVGSEWVTVATRGGRGTVRVEPGGQICENVDGFERLCQYAFTYGTVVTLYAEAAAESKFVGWGYSCSGTAPCRLTLNTSYWVDATFLSPKRQLSVTIDARYGASAAVMVQPGWNYCTNDGKASETCSYSYVKDSQVTLEPSLLSPGEFLGWSDACTGKGACTIALSDDSAVTATFTTLTHLLVSVNSIDFAEGEVLVDPPQASCAGKAGESTYCEFTYLPETEVQLTARAGTKSVFLGWSDGCSTEVTCRVTPSENTWVSAVFDGPKRLFVEVRGIENGKGVVTMAPPGTACRNDDGTAQCEETFAPGTVVTLSAEPDAGSVFIGWEGGCSGSAPTCQVTVPQWAAAVFEGPKTLYLEVQGQNGGHGTISVQPPGASCTAGGCQYTYTKGTPVTLVAQEDALSTFAGWNGVCSGTARTCRFTMSQSLFVDAAFDGPVQLTVDVSSTNGGKGSIRVAPNGASCATGGGESVVTCSYALKRGSAVVLTAKAESGSRFFGWGGACSGQNTICAFRMDGSWVVQADFESTNQAPTVYSWRVEPVSALTYRGTWLAADDNELARAVLMRAPYRSTFCDETSQNDCAWVDVASVSRPANVPPTGLWQGSVDDTPALGKWWYAVRVIDGLGAAGREPAPVLVDKRAWPDLNVRGFSWPGTASPGSLVNFVYMVRNDGSVATGVGFTNQLYVDGRRVLSSGSQVGSRTSASLSAGGSDTNGFQWRATCGTHTVQVVTDDLGSVVEWNESDNVSVPAHTLVVECALERF